MARDHRKQGGERATFSRVDPTCVGAVSPLSVMTWSKRPRSPRYGAAWAKTREQWAARHEPWHTCTRCHHPLGPMGPGLHLDHDDHDDHDPNLVRGFAHGDPCPYCNVRCNQSAGARKGSRIANNRRRVTQLHW